MSERIVKFKKNSLKAKIPFRKHTGDAGYDLYSIQDREIKPNSFAEVDTGISLQLPSDYYCEIHTRSSFGKVGVRVHLGIIDSEFRGNITVFVSTGPVGIQILEGDRIAQLILRKREEILFQEVEKLEDSSRGINGYGSTGR